MKKSLTLNESTARSIYGIAGVEIKTILEESFGKDFFNQKLTDRIKTIEDVYKELGRKMPVLSDYYFLPDKKKERALNTQYIDDITELFNEGWKPDFKNTKEYKYYPYFERKSSGWVFFRVYRSYIDSNMGSGFYYKDRDTAQYCGTQFLSIYSKVLE